MVKKNNFVPVQDLAGNILMVEPDKKKRGRPPKKPVEENITMVINEIKKRGRPKKYSTAEEARKAKIANTIASAKRRKEKREGEGILGDLYSGAKKVVGKVKEAVVDKVKSTIKTTKAVIYGRSDYPPKVRNIISKYGDKNITGIMMGRTPLGTPLLTALQVASGNTFSQKLENTPYDTLFHLFICIQLDSKDKIVLEKNEVINAEIGCKLPKETQTQNITSSDIPQGLTLNEALNKTQERMGGKYFTYSAKDNNCQDFIVAFLTANNIGNETDKSWVKQETKVLFEGNDRLRKIANTLTDIGARFDVVRQGAGTEQSKAGEPVLEGDPVSVILDSLSDLDLVNLFGGLFSSRVSPNQTYRMPNGMLIRITDEQYARMRGRVEAYKKKLQDAPKQTRRKKFDKGDGDGKGKDLFGAKAGKGKKGGAIDPLITLLTSLASAGAFAWLYSAYRDLQDNQVVPEEIAVELERVNIPIGSVVPIVEDIEARLEEGTLPAPIAQEIREAQAVPVARAVPLRTGRGNKKGGYVLPYNNNPIDQLNAFNTNAMLLGNQKRTKEQEDLRKLRGYGNKKSPDNNIGMANKWIEYVKAYAKKNNMKYSEALKDPKCKAGYKSGEGVFDVLKSVGKAVAPVAIDLASQYAKKKISGSGMPTSRDEYISQLYDQANLGANGKVRLN